MADTVERERSDGSALAVTPHGAKWLDESTATSRSLRVVSARLDPTWKVGASPSTPAVDRCVDIFSRPDGTFGFEEFRRDPEDMGAWTPVAYYSEREYATGEDALEAARASVTWLGEVLDASR